tara:strand:- start:39 stop:575 length:537 start_codon:yes stop_codon:yes gene_type:complete
MALLEISSTEQQDIKDKVSKEPDWYVNQYKNVWYVIQRHKRYGHYCGYIGLPCSIDLPIGQYDEHGHEIIEKLHSPYYNQYRLDMVTVHGGVTYHGNPTGFNTNPNINLDWIGFDCAHSSDYALSQDDDTTWMGKPRTYKTLEYCKNECQSVIEQYYKELEVQVDSEYKNRKNAFKSI